MSEQVKFFTRAFESSEMACSLKFEDVRGCPYNVFTARGIAALALSSSSLAILSLIIAM